MVAAWISAVRPLWMHHLPDLLGPASVCLAAGAVVSLRELQRRLAAGRRGWREIPLLLPLVLTGAGLVAHVRSYGQWQRVFANAPEASLRAVARVVARETAPEDWVVVDRGILAFLADRRVPPGLAMLSRKRMRTTLTDDDLTSAMDRYRPAMLVLCTGQLNRFEGFRARIEAGYAATRRIPLRDGGRELSCLFLRRKT